MAPSVRVGKLGSHLWAPELQHNCLLITVGRKLIPIALMSRPTWCQASSTGGSRSPKQGPWGSVPSFTQGPWDHEDITSGMTSTKSCRGPSFPTRSLSATHLYAQLWLCSHARTPPPPPATEARMLGDRGPIWALGAPKNTY